MRHSWFFCSFDIRIGSLSFATPWCSVISAWEDRYLATMFFFYLLSGAKREELKVLAISHSIRDDLHTIPAPVQIIVRDVQSRQRRGNLEGVSDCCDALHGVGASAKTTHAAELVA